MGADQRTAVQPWKLYYRFINTVVPKRTRLLENAPRLKRSNVMWYAIHSLYSQGHMRNPTNVRTLRISRRNLLRASAIAVAAGCGVIPRVAWCATPNSSTGSRGSEAFAYFTQDEIAFLDAAVDRLIPADDLGPGAKEANVTFFIDQQMAGSFGRAETWYMQGPWKQGTPQQGYQLKLTPAQLYRAGIRDVNEYCQRTFKKDFSELDAGIRDRVLHGLEKGDIALRDTPAKDFFEMLLKNTGEGFFADPIYGGNQHFAGWTLLGFPGPRYNYINEIDQFGKPYTLPPVGLAGRNGSPAKRNV